MKLTQSERAWLLILYNEGYRYLARDDNNDLYAYSKKPTKDDGDWTDGGIFKKLDEHLFSEALLRNYSHIKPFNIICKTQLEDFDLEEEV